MTGQVYIGKILELKPIEGADNIESLTVVCGEGGRWRGTAKKGQFAINDCCDVYLQDSILPQIDRFAFMAKYRYRVRMAKFKGVPSEVLIMPLSIGTNFFETNQIVGQDITELVGVIKYSKPIPIEMQGIMLGNFPAFIPRTDEPNFQRVYNMVEALKGKQFYSTVKADGSSATVYYRDRHFGCCSRRLEIIESADNVIWQIARQYKLEDFLHQCVGDFALQFEVVGGKIQGNKMGIQGIMPRLFSVFKLLTKDMKKVRL